MSEDTESMELSGAFCNKMDDEIKPESALTQNETMIISLHHEMDRTTNKTIEAPAPSDTQKRNPENYGDDRGAN